MKPKSLSHLLLLEGNWYTQPLYVFWNVALLYAAYFVCRIVYFLENLDAFRPVSEIRWDDILTGSWYFDSSAMVYTLGLYILLSLLPVHLLQGKTWERVKKAVYLTAASVSIMANISDSVYFAFTGRRTTASVFSEFSNDSNIAKVMLTEGLNHWYLVLLTLALIALLSWLYLSPSRFRSDRGVRALVRYYAANTIFLALAAGLCIGAVRGGFSHSVRPITVSNANQYAKRPAEAALVLNTAFTMVRTLGTKTFSDPGYFSREELDTLYSPVRKCVSQEPLRKRNIVFLIVESLGREYVGAANRDLDGGEYRGYTPFLDSLWEHSLTFEHTYSNGRKSIDAMPSVLSSIPRFLEPFFLTDASMNDLSGIAGELAKVGYSSAFFHGAPNGSMGFEAFARKSGFGEYVGKTEFDTDPRFDAQNDFDGMWAIWDEPFLQFSALRFSQCREPFVNCIFTASSHHPFRIPQKYEGRFQDDNDNPMHKCVQYADYALRRFFETASREPWYNNTLFVIVGDHTNLADHAEYLSPIGLFSTAMFIYDPSVEFPRGHMDIIAQQIDLMPTLLEWMHYPNSYIAFGKNLLSTKKGEDWAVNNNNGLYQYLRGDYLIQFTEDSSLKGVYHLCDRCQNQNLIEEDIPEVSPMLTELKAIIQSYMQRMLEDRISLHE